MKFLHIFLATCLFSCHIESSNLATKTQSTSYKPKKAKLKANNSYSIGTTIRSAAHATKWFGVGLITGIYFYKEKPNLVDQAITYGKNFCNDYYQAARLIIAKKMIEPRISISKENLDLENACSREGGAENDRRD